MTRAHAALAAILLIADARGQRVETCAGDCLDGITIFAPHDGTVVCMCCLSQVQLARCDYLHYTCRPLGASSSSDYFRVVRAPDWPFCLEPASILPTCTFQRPPPVFDFATSSGGRTPSDPGGGGYVNPADGEAAHATRDKLIGAAAGGALGGVILLAALATLCIRRCRRKQPEQRTGDPDAAEDDNDNQTIPSFGFRGNGEDYDPFSAPQPSPFPRPRGASNPYLPEAAETESRDGDDTVYPAYSVSPTLRTTSNTPLGLQKWSDLPKLPKFDFEDP